MFYLCISPFLPSPISPLIHCNNNQTRHVYSWNILLCWLLIIGLFYFWMGCNMMVKIVEYQKDKITHNNTWHECYYWLMSWWLTNHKRTIYPLTNLLVCSELIVVNIADEFFFHKWIKTINDHEASTSWCICCQSSLDLPIPRLFINHHHSLM